MSSYRYILRVGIPATDLRILRDAFEDEPLSLREILGEATFQQQLDDLSLVVDLQVPEPWENFSRDIEVLSVYLAAPVSGVEIRVAGSDTEGWRWIGMKGEVVRVPLTLSLEQDGSVEIVGVDGERLAKMLPTMPRWAQSLFAPRVPRLYEAAAAV